MSNYKRRLRRQGARAERPIVLDPNLPEFVAMHEAGHAVAAVVLGQPLKLVHIRQEQCPDGMISLGYTDQGGSTPYKEIATMTEAELMPRLIQTMAGYAAELTINPTAIVCGGGQADKDAAIFQARLALCDHTLEGGKMVISEEEARRKSAVIVATLNRAHFAAGDLVREHVTAILAVADQLLERIELSGDEVRAIVAAN